VWLPAREEQGRAEAARDVWIEFSESGAERREWMAAFAGHFVWLTTGVLLLLGDVAWAAEAAAPTPGGLSVGTISIITGGFAMAIASAAAAIGQSRAIVAALEGIARQPTAAPRIQVAMIIGLALIESLAIYVLLISLIVFFVKPFGG
jgi:F-type H+-transporting ATPase subunit c